MAGTLIVSNLKTDTDNTFIVRSNTGTTLFSANTSGIDVANSIGATAITNDKILSVANTKISGNIISSQIAPDQTLNGNVTVGGTGFLKLPSGTTAQRPGTPVAGQTRYNSSLVAMEYYNGTSWQPIIANYTYPVTYLTVAGGGGAGGKRGGGGGAGGYLTGTFTASLSTVYTATVGAFGAGAVASDGVNGSQGSNTSLTGTTTVIGGGAGSTQFNSGTNASVGGNGGSGGGGGGASPSGVSGGSATSGQGSAGGTSSGDGGGGGGGSGGVGGNGGVNTGGTGGLGTVLAITGSSVTYAAGGGGGGQVTGGVGGSSGVGGTGSGSGGGQTAGSASTGSGGGGNNSSSSVVGGNGSDGIVILSVPTVNYSGTTTGTPTITTSGANTIIKFTSSGTYTA